METPVRVLQVFNQMNRAGAETMLMNLYRNMDQSRIQFDFIVFEKAEGMFDQEIRELGGHIYYIPKLSLKSMWLYIKRWNDFFDENRGYKIIHSHIRSTASIYLYIAKKHGLITIAHSHSTVESRDKKIQYTIKRILEFPLGKIADYHFACSDAAAKWLFGPGILQSPSYYLLKNAVDTDALRYNPEKEKEMKRKWRMSGNFVVGHVGRFSTPKNHKKLIDIFEKVAQIDDSSRLILVGDGELRIEIENRVREKGLEDKVVFAGIQKNVSEFLQMMDVFVMPSLYEGLPVSAIEAQAAGIPCILSDAVTEEVIVNDSAKRLPIGASTQVWAEEILKYKSRKKTDTQKLIAERGYDIKETSKWLTDFYLSLSSQCRASKWSK